MSDTKKVTLVAKFVREIAKVQGKDLNGEAKNVAKIALNPPTWVTNADHWLDVVVRGLHTNYGGAVQHYKASCRKHAIPEPNVVGVTRQLNLYVQHEVK